MKQCNKKEKIAASNKKYRQNNKEKIAEHKKEYYKKNKEKILVYLKKNKERLADSGKLYRQTHKEEIAKYNKRYREKNKEKLATYRKEYNKQYREDNKEQLVEYRQTHKKQIAKGMIRYAKGHKSEINAWSAKRRAMKKNATVSYANLEKIKEYYIAAEILSHFMPEQYHVDHVIPLQSPLVCGLHHEGNLQVITAKENLIKHNKFEPIIIDYNK